MNEHQKKPLDGGEPGKLLRADVAGASTSTWIELRELFVKTLKDLLAQPLDVEKGTTVEDELRELGKGLLDFAKAKLEMPAAEVEKVYAEVSKLYAERQNELAQARKANAEAASQEQLTRIRDLRLKLGMMKAMLVGEQDEEALILSSKLDSLLAFLKDIEQSGHAS